MWLHPIDELYTLARLLNFLLIVFGVFLIFGITRWLRDVDRDDRLLSLNRQDAAARNSESSSHEDPLDGSSSFSFGRRRVSSPESSPAKESKASQRRTSEGRPAPRL